MQQYLQELASLEDDFAQFSAAHPQVAGQLGMGSEGTTDPHVRQLIEAVAYIAARLQRKVHSAPGEIAYSMLQSLAPHLVAPVPSMSVARFVPLSWQLDPVVSRPPMELRLRASSPDGDCLFTTPPATLKLWPLRLEAFWAGADSTAEQKHSVPGFSNGDCFAMRIDHISKKLPKGMPEELTFFISGALNRALAAVDALTTGVQSIHMVALDGSWSKELDRRSLEIVGFSPSDRLLPIQPGMPDSGPLTAEFMAFPRRFCFLRARNLHLPAASQGFFLVFELSRSWIPAVNAVRHNIHLNCAPVINLFRTQPLAVYLKGYREEYPLPRPARVSARWDVHSVHRVKLTGGDDSIEIPEFHSGIAANTNYRNAVSWQGVRNERTRNELAHASLAMRFLNLGTMQREPDMALVDTVCTNCEAPQSLAAGHDLKQVDWDSAYRAQLEFVPTPYVAPSSAAAESIETMLQLFQWRSVNMQVISQRIRRYLGLHNRVNSPYAAAVVAGLQSIDMQVVAMPWPGMPGGALTMGCQYDVKLNDADSLVGSRYLVAKLIRQILAQIHSSPLPLTVRVYGRDGVFRNVH